MKQAGSGVAWAPNMDVFVHEGGAVVKAELFPAHIRALGVALPYAIANTIFGGTAEYVALLSVVGPAVLELVLGTTLEFSW